MYVSIVCSEAVLVEYIGHQLEKLGYTKELHLALKNIQKHLQEKLGRNFQRASRSVTIISNPIVEVTAKGQVQPPRTKREAEEKTESRWQKPSEYSWDSS